MRILFDYQAFEMQNFGGVSKCFAELASGLNSCGDSCVIGVKESSNTHLIEKGFGSDIKPRYYNRNRVFGTHQHFPGEYRLKEMLIQLFRYSITPNRDYCIDLLKQQRFDVFEPTYFNSYFLPFVGNKPFVLTVHDLIPERYPELFGENDYQVLQRRILCPLAQHIHVPSQNTKKDLIEFYGVDPEKITVIPHGGPVESNIDAVSAPVFDFPYLLYVGTRWGYKNFFQFLDEYKKVVSDVPDVRLVCTGPALTDDENRVIYQLGLQKHVIHYFASETELSALYQNAIAFVYPSAYEGFGIPILEAYANQCPVLLNNASCFPEVAGDAALYFDMGAHSNFYEVFKSMYRMGNDKRAELIDCGLRRLKMYSWKKSAQMLHDVYESVI